MSFSNKEIFSKRFNLFILITITASLSIFSLLVNKIASSKEDSKILNTTNGFYYKNKSIKEETICLNGLVFRAVNGNVVSKVMEKEHDPVYAQDGRRITISQKQENCR